MTASDTSTSSGHVVFRNRQFALYLVGSTISSQGFWLQRVAIGWLAWDLTHSEFWVGLIAFMDFAPMALFGPIFGVLADRVDRRRMAVAVSALALVNAGIIATLIWLELIDIYSLALLAFIHGCVASAYTPVRMTLVPNLVTRAELPSALAISSITFNLSRFTGPALAGIVIATLGVAAAIALNSISYLSVIAVLSVIKFRAQRRTAQRKAMGAELLAGLRYVLRHDKIAMILSFAAITSVFARGVMELLPAYADTVLGGGSGTFAALTSATGVGAILAGLWLASNRAQTRLRLLTGTAPLAAGAGLIALTFATTTPVALAVAAFIGMAATLAGVGTQTLFQIYVDEDYRGRVAGIWTLVGFGGVAFGGLILGSVATFAGLIPTIVGSGCVAIVLALLLFPRYMRREHT